MPNTLLSFDLRIKTAKTHVGSIRLAYAKIEGIAIANGFKRLQASLFISNYEMSDEHRQKFKQTIADTLPWLRIVAKDARIFVVANDISATDGDPRQLRLPF